MKPTRRLFDHQAIGLLGGSFNPAHQGHLDISLAALSRLGLDQVWWLVTPGNPQKDARQYAPYEMRLEKARTVSGHPKIKVLDYEKRHGLIYTVDTLTHLTHHFSQTQFVWLMGADSLVGFDTWRNWQEIITMMPMAVFNRPGQGLAALTSKTANIYRDARLDARDGGLLSSCSAPKWIYIPQTHNHSSATAIRARSKGNWDN